MALIQNDSEYTRLERSIDRMFNEFFADMNISRRLGFSSGLVIQPNANGPQSQMQVQRVFCPTVDAYERPDAYTIYCEFPGARREDLHLEVRGDSVLYIQGQIKFNQERHQGDQVRYQERCFGRFERRIPIPESVKRDEIKAKLEHGVLEINIPKNQQSAKKINIA